MSASGGNAFGRPKPYVHIFGFCSKDGTAPGVTSLWERLVGQPFSIKELYSSTIGLGDGEFRTLVLDEKKTELKLYFYGPSTQEKFADRASEEYVKTGVAVFVVDGSLSEQEQVNQLEDIEAAMTEELPSTTPRIVVITKRDLPSMITRNQVAAKLKVSEDELFEVSAKTDEDYVFDVLAKQIAVKYQKSLSLNYEIKPIDLNKPTKKQILSITRRFVDQETLLQGTNSMVLHSPAYQAFTAKSGLEY